MKNFILIGLLLSLTFLGCEKDAYKDDGGVSNAYVDMTTYDYLKSHPKFDSLVRVIDRAGMQDAVNGNITFFATTNYGVADFITVKKQEKVIELGDENITFTIDDLNPSEMQDSLRLYMFDGALNREHLKTGGELYDCLLGPIDNTKFLIKLRRTREFGDFRDFVDYVNFTKVIGSRDDLELNQDAIPQEEKDLSFDCQTSGIITTTGIIHVLSGHHRLFFNQSSPGS